MTMTITDINQALDFWENGHQPVTLDGLPPAVLERIPLSEEHAKQAVSHVTREDVQRVHDLIRAASAGSTSGQRVYWLQKAAQALSDAYGPHAACKSGCAHCCHIPVKITQAEAIYIGRKLGRAPLPAGKLPSEPHIQGYEAPCPFLADNTCSIHAHRPAVCPSHLNLDKDDLLCQLQPGMAVPVPYLDTRPLVMAAFQILGPQQLLADIRQWFASSARPVKPAQSA
jgi:hypothetical protein